MSFFNFFQKGIQIADSLLLFEPTWHSLPDKPHPLQPADDDFSTKQFLQNIYSHQPNLEQAALLPALPPAPPSVMPASAFSELSLVESAAYMAPHLPDMTSVPSISKPGMPQVVAKHRFFFQNGQ